MSFEQENAQLRAENAVLRQLLQQLMQDLQAAQERIEELEHKTPASKSPPWAKSNKPKKEGPHKPRRKRKAEHNRARKREEPTKVVDHQWEHCPDCGSRLHRSRLSYSRQVIEIPPPPPVEVIEHRVIKGWCPHCEHWRAPKLDLMGVVLGQGRFGVHLASRIAYLRTVLRLPIQQIQAYLKDVHKIRISQGEISDLIKRVSEVGKPALDALWKEMRESEVVHADETGWRENGQNGHVWTFNTPGPAPIRLFWYSQSRSHWVAQGCLGPFHGVLSTDFYAGYNFYAGLHQRCWVHLLRDLHGLKEGYPDREDVLKWAKEVRVLYEEGQECIRSTAPPEERQAKYNQLLHRVRELGRRYAQESDHPCWALAKRLLRHDEELFQFVLRPGLSADNNLAERSLRPLVIARKISGGTRSPSGTKARMALASLMGTWLARALNPFEELLSLLRQTPVPQV